MMDSCSSNASSVTSFDLEAEQQEIAEKPLSPVLSTSKINRRVFLDRKLNKQKSKVRLASRFTDDNFSSAHCQNLSEYQNVSIVGQMHALDVYEEQRKRYYELLCDGNSEDIYRDRQCSSESISEYSTIRSSPIQQVVDDNFCNENIETMVNYHFNQNAKTVRFCTAGGKCIDISEDSLEKSNEIFEDIVGFHDEELLNDYPVFKNPTSMKKKLSKIPVTNQTKKNIIKTKATRSTYEEIKIDMSDIMVRQTEVHCYEDIVRNDSSTDFSISNTDSGEIVGEETFAESMNKIYSNKKFMEFSSSSAENEMYNNPFIETTDDFTRENPEVLNNNSIQIENIYKSKLENVVDEDWSNTKRVQRSDVEQRRKNALTKYRKPQQCDANLDIKQVNRETSLPPLYRGQRKQQEIFGNNINKEQNQAVVQQIPLHGNILHQKVGCCKEVNMEATTSKNLVVVPMSLANGDGDTSYRSIVELHRNTNFNPSHDSVQNFGLPIESAKSRKKSPKRKKHQDGFLGFSTEEQQQAKKTFVKVTEAVERIGEGLQVEKKKNEKKTKKNRKEDHDKASTESVKGDSLEKPQKREKSKHRKPKKETDSIKGEQENLGKRTLKSANVCVARRNEPTHDTEVGDSALKQEEIETITYDHLSIVAEKCKKSNNKKRKDPSGTLPIHYSELIEKGNENQTIELSPNQKKFKIEIDCNSKFRINISCNGDHKSDNIDPLQGDTLTDLNTQACLDKLNCPSVYDLQQPRGKLVKKFINKAQELYRNVKDSELNSTEKAEERNNNLTLKENDNLIKIPQVLNKDIKFCNKITKLHKQNHPVIESSPNYAEVPQATKEVIQFSGFQTAGGSEIRFSEKSLNKARKMYEESCENQILLEKTQKEPIRNLGFKTAGGKGVKISENAVNRAKRMFENIDNYMETIDDNRRGGPYLQKEENQHSEIILVEKANDPIRKENDNELFKIPAIPNKDTNLPNQRTHRKQNNSVKGSEPNYEEISESTKEIVECGSFKTASGRDLKLSEKALKKAKKIYEDTYEGDDTFKDTQEEPVINLGFKTAGGRNIKIPENTINRAKRMFQNIDNYMDEINDNTGNNSNLQKDIKISEKTLNKAKKMFEILAAEKKSVAEVCQTDVEVTKEEKKVDKVLSRMKTLYYNLNNEYNVNENVTKRHDIQNLEHSVQNKKTTAPANKFLLPEKAMNEEIKMFEGIVNETEDFKIGETLQGFDIEEPTKDKKKITSENYAFFNGNNENNLYGNCKEEIGFQTGAGETIGITSRGLEKAKALFGDFPYQAGDFDSACIGINHDNPIYDTDSLTTAQIYHQVVEKPDFCRGDFIPSSENTTFDKTFPSEEIVEMKTTSVNTQSSTKPLKIKASKKAFELLEDVVETVDHALQSIDEKFRRPRLSVSRKRLGMPKLKPINIPNEKLERAKLLFKEDLNSTVTNLCDITTPIKISQGTTCSTPILKHQSSSVSINCNIISKEHSALRGKPADALIPSILICERTKGNIEDWFSLINSKVEFMKMQLKDLEEKKSYLIFQKEKLERNKAEIVSPHPGILIRKKEHVKLHLKDLKTNMYYTDNISECILKVTPQNAESVHFTFERSSGDSMGLFTTLDGALIIPNVHNIIGFTEIELAFNATPGVDTKLIPCGWLENHYKLVIWKLASYERFLSAHLRGCLTVENVMQQLKYRYDREIDKAERPALRKILEKDDVPQKRIVWCVTNIEEADNNEIELTDGWYCIKTIIDDSLAAQISKNKIKIGTKLVTTGAQILNCDGCHPLEVPHNVKLRITYNSTRRAPWYAKLGYQRCAKSLLIPLHSIRPDGGMIGCIKIYIARVYPLRFMEQINDVKIWRNSKAEAKRAREFENERLSKMEKVHYEVQKKYEQERLREKKNSLMECSKFSKSELLKITCPETLLSLLESSNDPDELMEYLSPSQRANVLDYRQTVCLQRQHEITQKISEEMEKLKLAKRKVVSILKLLVLDATSESDKGYQFCVWNPSEEHFLLLREYNVYYTYNILPRFNGELFSTNKTFFKLDRKMSHNKYKRQAYPIAMLLNSHYRPTFNEFDTVGIIVYINVMDSEQTMWMADILGNLLFVKVRDGPKFCRLLDDIVRGDVVSVQNLLYCPPQTEFGVAIANQFTLITKSMQNHLRECMEMFKLQLPKDLAKFLGECSSKIERCERMDAQLRAVSDVPILQCGLKLSPNSKASLDDSSEENSVIPQKLTATDIAMSLIDTDQFI